MPEPDKNKQLIRKAIIIGIIICAFIGLSIIAKHVKLY